MRALARGLTISRLTWTRTMLTPPRSSVDTRYVTAVGVPIRRTRRSSLHLLSLLQAAISNPNTSNEAKNNSKNVVDN